MKRTIPLLFLLAGLITAVGLLVALPASPPAPMRAAVTPSAQNMKFLRQLELAYADEARGQWSEAESAYRAAALAEDDAIAQLGRDNYNRLSMFRQSPLYNLQSSLAWIKSPLPWLTLLLLMLLVILLYFPRPVAYHVFAFADFSKDQAGKSLHLLVIRKLEAVRAAYHEARKELILEMEHFNLPAPAAQPDPYADILSLLGTQTFGPVSVPMDKIKNFLEKWRDRNENQLTGQLYQGGSTFYLDVNISRGGRIMDQWLLRCTSSWDAAIESFQNEIVYRFLMLVFDGKTSFKGWETLRAWSEGWIIYKQSPPDRAARTQAIQMLTEAHSREPDNRDLDFLLGMFHFKQEAYAEARAAFARVIQSEKAGDDLSLIAALRLAETRYLEFDISEFATAEGEFDAMIQALHGRAQNERQKQIEALALCGKALIHAHWMFGKNDQPGRMEQVSDWCQKALSLANQSGEIRAACAMALGIAQVNSHRPQQALDNFRTAVQIRRNYPAALIRAASVLADLVISQKNTAAVLEEQAIQAHSDGDQARLKQILAQIDVLSSEAIALFTESIKEGLPGRDYAAKRLSDLYTGLGRLHVKTVSLERGLEDYDRAVLVNPKNADAWDNYAYRIVEGLRQGSDKKDDPQRAPEELHALLDKAEAAARQAVQLGADEGSAQQGHYCATLVEVLMQQGDFSRAQQALDQALALPNCPAQITQHLKRLQEKLRQRRTGTIQPE